MSTLSPRLYYPYVVEPFQEDFTGKLAWSTLGNLLLRVSSLHAESHGFGYSYMQHHHRGWVLSRLIIELYRRPRTGESYTLSTWVNKIFRQFTDRLYTLQDEDGETVGYGHSTWALIDYDSRQPINLEQLPDGGFSEALHPEDVPIAGAGRVRVKSATPCLVHHAAFSDLDINGHVNSIRYLSLILDTFSKEWHERHELKRVEMSYGLEAYAGDELRVYAEELGEEQWGFEIRRVRPSESEQETLVVRSRIIAPLTVRV